ncbi:MAG TPA: DUF2142 domain-containing protein, partial [Candidatus Saccharimonadaceae bacterium]|nr:DUF2142 domain-containing protein [Candidatus Saccharimonadaceae bacterium]
YYPYRDLVHETSYLYHYLMSFPYRGMQLFTQSLAVNVIFLRLINIAMVAVGLVGFRRLFRKVGIAERYVAVGLALVIFVPLFTLVAATINYDNMLFMVVPFYLIACIDALREKKLSWLSVARVAVLGMFVGLIKYTFLPLFLATVVFVLVCVVARDKKMIFRNFWTSLKKAPWKRIALWGVPFVLLLALFSGIYIRNVIVYHNPSPACTQSMALKECLVSGIEQRNIEAQDTASQRPVSTLAGYTYDWITIMRKNIALSMNSTSTANSVPVVVSSGIYTKAQTLAIAVLLFSIALAAGVWLRKREWLFLLFSAAAVIVAVYLFDVDSYYDLHATYGDQPRYLFDAMPILAVIGVYAFARISIGRTVKYAALIVVLLAGTQGAGVITHIAASNSSWYWDDPALVQANDGLKKVVSTFVRHSHP